MVFEIKIVVFELFWLPNFPQACEIWFKHHNLDFKHHDLASMFLQIKEFGDFSLVKLGEESGVIKQTGKH